MVIFKLLGPAATIASPASELQGQTSHVPSSPVIFDVVTLRSSIDGQSMEQIKNM